jgi:hypothetical protein
LVLSTLGACSQRIDELFAEEGEAAGAEFKQEPGCRIERSGSGA